MSVIFMLEQ